MKPQVSTIKQATFLDSKNNLIVGYAVTFNVGTQGPFIINIAQTDFSAAEVIKRTEAFAAELNQIPMGG